MTHRASGFSAVWASRLTGTIEPTCPCASRVCGCVRTLATSASEKCPVTAICRTEHGVRIASPKGG